MMDDAITALLGLPASLEGADAEQLAFAERLRNGRRKSVPSPFLAMMDAPALADAIQAVGIFIRFESSVDAKLREIAILSTAAGVDCAYEWNYHRPIALDLGVPWAVVRATHARQSSQSIDATSQLVIDFCKAMVRRAPDAAALRDEAIAAFGRRITSEFVAIAGYYPLLANFIKLGGHNEAPYNLADPY